MITVKFLSVVTLVFATGILSVESKGRIYNGAIANQEVFYYQAQLSIHVNTINGTKIGKCGGSVIHYNWILTAAHCFIGRGGDVGKVVVSFGANENNDYVIASKVITHECYNVTKYINDIALLQIPSVTYRKYIRNIPLCGTGSFEDKKVTVSGWGLTENGTSSTELRYTQMNVLNSTACAEKFDRPLMDYQFCCFEETYNACVGDSGGPAVIFSSKYARLAGIVSFGRKRCSPNSPVAFTRVSDFVPWIERVTQIKFQTVECY